MHRLLLALFTTLAFAGITAADYTSVGGGYYVNEYGDYATARNRYFGYYYDCYGRYVPRYYYVEYTPASTPVSSLTPKSTDAEWIDFLKQREKIQGRIATSESEHKAFLEKLAKIGVTPPFPALPEYGGNSFTYRQAYVPPLQGASAYGYSIRQEADLYQPFNVDAALQTLGLLGNNSLSVSREVGSAIKGAVDQQLASTERVAMAREDTRRIVETLRETRPPSRITTTVTGTGNGPAFPPVPKEGEPEPRAAVSVASTSCINCHNADGGKKAAGGLDMTKAPSEDQVRKMAYRMSLPPNDPKMMPQAADGKPAKPLTPAQMANVINEAAKASQPKP